MNYEKCKKIDKKIHLVVKFFEKKNQKLKSMQSIRDLFVGSELKLVITISITVKSTIDIWL